MAPSVRDANVWSPCVKWPLHGSCAPNASVCRDSNGERQPAATVQLKRCRGVCCGREDPRQHDLRLLSALDSLRMPDWPWPDAVSVNERRPGAGKGERHWLAHWCHLGSEPEQEAVGTASQADARFDYDHYRILRRHLDDLPPEAVTPVRRAGSDASEG
jgi:DNA polymerase-3 subunit epsilon